MEKTRIRSGKFAAPASYVPHGAYYAIAEISNINNLYDVAEPQITGGYKGEAFAISGNKVQVKIYSVVVGGSGSTQALTELVSGTNISGNTINLMARGY